MFMVKSWLRYMAVRLLLITLFAWSCLAQTLLTADVIIRLVAAGVNDDIIIDLIHKCVDRSAVTSEDILRLRESNVSQRVISSIPQSRYGSASPLPHALRVDTQMEHQDWRMVGPWGGTATTMAIDSKRPAHLLAGGRHSLLFATEDHGLRWSLIIFPRSPFAEITSLLIDEVNGRHYLVGLTGGVAGGLFETYDAGVTWKANPAFSGISVRGLAADRVNPAHLVAGSTEGVFESSDSGEHWRRISELENSELQGISSVAIDSNSPETIYAGTTHLAWKTRDQGRTWLPIHQGMIDDSDVFFIDPDPNTPEHVLAGACSGGYASTSGGSVWHRMNGISEQCRRTHVIRVDPRRSSTIYVGTTCGLFKSSDNGRSWFQHTSQQLNSLIFNPELPTTFYMALQDDGISVSEDGGNSFQSLNEGFVARDISDLTTSGDHLFAIGTAEGSSTVLFVSDDDGDTWRGGPVKALEGIHLRTLASDVSAKGVLFAADSNRIFKSKDGGHQWTMVWPDSVMNRCTSGDIRSSECEQESDGQRKLTRINRLVSVRVQSSGEVLAATDEGLLISLDQGLTWESTLRGMECEDIYVSPDSSGPIFVRTAKALYVSTSAGRNWTAASTPVTSSEINEVAVPPHVSGLPILAATMQGIIASNDEGHTWVLRRNGAPMSSIDSIVFDAALPRDAYAVGFNRLYRSTDGGVSWTATPSNFDAITRIRRLWLPVVRGRNQLLATTDSLGILTRLAAAAPY
jgi:photosystem II stability/assembly factor-like uncharacterized protein